jgi:hypothetical protein
MCFLMYLFIEIGTNAMLDKFKLLHLKTSCFYPKLNTFFKI